MTTKRLNFNSFDKGEGNDYSETLVFSSFFQQLFFGTGEYRATFCLACEQAASSGKIFAGKEHRQKRVTFTRWMAVSPPK